ncbi:MAG: FtsW/RodA/SpoVE family cell cycle protein [Leptospiraceae bacterium]|nr:FtsW/RodA/SpoVE family cell cycle protein [Leptospiraceae bacterium]MDW7977094.1 FtsW/RodA/SpoVE family cell cycle protein [Leptospiraceae bacterium]
MRYKFDWVLFLSAFLATIIGIITLYTQENFVEDPPNRWLKQTFFLAFVLIVFFVFFRVHYQTLGNYSIGIYLVAIFLLLITLVPFIGAEIKGARSWIRLGFINFQTSEFAKLASILLLAKFLEIKEKEMGQLSSLLLASLIFLLPILLILVQPDLGGAMILAPILLSMLFVGGADILHITSIILFFGISLLIPLFIEYHNIILVDSLIERLYAIDKVQFIPAVNILKFQIWKFLETSKIPKEVQSIDLEYLNNLTNNVVLFTELKEIAYSVRYEKGGFLIKIFDNDTLLLIVSILLLVIAGILFFIRLTQGIVYHYLRKYYIPLGVIGISLLSAYLIHNSFSFKYHQVVRVTAFLNPDKFPRDLAYQIRASKVAIGSGQLFGKGLQSAEMTTGKNPIVPESFTDFIFASWAERTGFLGSIILLILLSLVVIRGFYIAISARDRFGSLLASGITFLYLYHIVFNIGIEIGLMPVTGLPLSFVSYGGSHLLICYIGLGILQSIYSRKYINI